LEKVKKIVKKNKKFCLLAKKTNNVDIWAEGSIRPFVKICFQNAAILGR